MRIARALCAAIVCIPLAALSQTPSQQPFKSLRAARAAESIRLDGKLDESSWDLAESGSEFVQRYPNPGRAATMRTEVRVLYDESAIYVGARMFDPHPDSITAPLARRDPDAINSDWIDVIFDSYRDRRTGYRFGVNPAGTKLDVYHFNDGDQDDSWDAHWEAATRIDSLGWTAEMRIPLSQFRFHGDAGEQKWGLQFYRAVARRDEWSHWVEYPPTRPGFISTFGDLTGLVGLAPSSPVEITPYASSRVATGGDMQGAGGVDFRVGLGSALSLTGTVNPDFGQVEVDPAVINLSAVETFFPEKRPFFLEGAGIFEFGRVPSYAEYGFSRFVHWRRIGRTPQLTPSGEFTRMPEQTTILGAAKLSGQLGSGWSLGVLNATTQREQARLVSADGIERAETVEPFSNYAVVRAKRDLGGGRSNVGLMATAVNRSLDEFSRSTLKSSAYLLGIDGAFATRDRRLTASGYVIGSGVSGSTESIGRTQRSSARYYARPDATHFDYDSTRTTLGGYDAAASLLYQGKPYYGSVSVHQTSPGYESNDLGYLARADFRSIAGAFGTQANGMSGLIRDGRVKVYALQASNLGGDVIYRKMGFTSSATFNSLWSGSAGLAWKPVLMDDRRTRGGPLTRSPRQWEATWSMATDSRKPMILSFAGEYESWTTAGSAGSYMASLVLRPSPSIQLSAGPSLEVIRDEAQYVRTVKDPLQTETFGARYVFARLDQRTTSVNIRADWTLTPELSFQLFAQPFRSSAKFSDYKELQTPSSYAFDIYGRDKGSIVFGEDAIVIDPDGSGAATPFTIGSSSAQASFLSRELRANAVMRWEFRTGSSLYLVWQQTRDGNDAPARNILLAKASYRVGR